MEDIAIKDPYLAGGPGVTEYNTLGTGGVTTDVRCVNFNSYRRLHLGHTLLFTFRYTFIKDGSPSNSSITQLTQGLVPCDWRGNVLVMRQRGQPQDLLILDDMTPADARSAADYFIAYGNSSASAPKPAVKPAMVKAVKVLCDGEANWMAGTPKSSCRPTIPCSQSACSRRASLSSLVCRSWCTSCRCQKRLKGRQGRASTKTSRSCTWTQTRAAQDGGGHLWSGVVAAVWWCAQTRAICLWATCRRSVCLRTMRCSRCLSSSWNLGTRCAARPLSSPASRLPPLPSSRVVDAMLVMIYLEISHHLD